MSKAGFWEKLEREWDAVNRSTIVVRGDDSLSLSDYKVYINRNVHGTGERFAQVAPPNSVYSRVRAGVYRVVVREHDVRKPGRLESNTVELELAEDEEITIRVSLLDGCLVLTSEPPLKPTE